MKSYTSKEMAAFWYSKCDKSFFFIVSSVFTMAQSTHLRPTSLSSLFRFSLCIVETVEAGEILIQRLMVEKLQYMRGNGWQSNLPIPSLTAGVVIRSFNLNLPFRQTFSFV